MSHTNVKLKLMIVDNVLNTARCIQNDMKVSKLKFLVYLC